MNTFDMVKIVKKTTFLINRHLYHYRPHPRLPHHLRPCLLPHLQNRNEKFREIKIQNDINYWEIS